MAAAHRAKGGPLARLAGMWANEPAFLEWMRINNQPANTANDAAEFIRARCCIESRAELDHNAMARALFDSRIRHPYARYRASVERL